MAWGRSAVPGLQMARDYTCSVIPTLRILLLQRSSNNNGIQNVHTGDVTGDVTPQLLSMCQQASPKTYPYW